MPFKSDYLATVGLTSATYTVNGTAAYRIQGLYQTARTGRIGSAFGTLLWTQFFAPLASQISSLPSTQQLYDTFATKQMCTLAALLRQQRRGDFGHAQKMVNLFMKDHWALNLLTQHSETLLHLPLDHGMLSKLLVIPAPWSSWTKVVVTPSTQQQVVTAYLQIQASFRAYWQHIAPRFSSPIEMEQMLWQRI